MSSNKSPEKGPHQHTQGEFGLSNTGSKDRSFSQRLGTSASGLLQSFNGHDGQETVLSSLASFHTSISKGESSSSSTQEGPLSIAQLSGTIQGTSSRDIPLQQKETFKAQSTHDSVRAQEDFDQWSTSNAHTSENDVEANEMPRTAWGLPFAQAEKAPANSGIGDEARMQYNGILESDGAAVSALLSQPSFEADIVSPGAWESISQGYASGAGGQSLNNVRSAMNLSALSQDILEQEHSFAHNGSFKPDVPNMITSKGKSFDIMPSSQRESIEPYRLQSLEQNRQMKMYGLIPNFWDSKPISMKSTLEKRQRDEIIREISIAEEGIKPWLNILDKYQDEVWGEVLPLVQDARKEVKRVDQSRTLHFENPRVGPAVRRLKLVLQHMDHWRD